MTPHEISIYLLLSAGLLAMTLGAFGLLDALNKRSPGSRRRTLLIMSYAAGVLMCAFALAFNGQWYLGAVVALMIVPVDSALRPENAPRGRTPQHIDRS